MTRLCLNTLNHSPLFGATVDPEVMVVAAADAGFDQIGLDRYFLRAYCDAGGAVEKLAGLVAERGLDSLEMPGLHIGSDEEESLAEAREVAGYAAHLRPEYILTRVTAPVDAAVIDRLRRCADVLAEVGAKVALEFDGDGTAKTIDQARAILDRAKLDGAGIIIDTWHFFNGADQWGELAALPIDELAFVQWSDGFPFDGGDWRAATTDHRTFSGEGTFELERFVRELKGKGFDGGVSVEMLSKEARTMEPAAFASRAYETTRSFWSR